MPELRRSKRKRKQSTKTVSSPSSKPNTLIPAIVPEVQSDSQTESEPDSDTETCRACTQTSPPVKRYSDSNWIQCDACRQWWHAECACMSIDTIKKLAKHKIPYTCPLCVFDCSSWVKTDNRLSYTSKAQNVTFTRK